MKEKNKKEKTLRFLSRLRNFFFPKDFFMQIAVGRQIGSQHQLSDKVYNWGKSLRKKIDPEHKMKVGKKKEKIN